MIEKFTPEELAQIRKELRERDRVAMKDRLLREQFSRAIHALAIGNDPDIHDSFGIHDVKSALTMLADHATRNYVLNENKSRKGQKVWKRNPLVPGGMEDRYLEAYTRIVDALVEAAEE